MSISEQTSPSELVIPRFRQSEKPRLLTIDEICLKENSSRENIGVLLKERSKKFVSACMNNSIIDDRFNSQIDFIYNVYAATRNLTQADNLRGISDNLIDFTSFSQAYAIGASERTIASLVNYIDFFTDQAIHPGRLITLDPDQNFPNIYDYEGDWIPIHHKNQAGKEQITYADISVLEEIKQLQKEEYTKPGLYHSTGSPALEGIARHKAIISADRARSLDEPVRTGEALTQRIESEVVYASPIPIVGYSQYTWFDDYKVIFGFAKERIQEYTEKYKDDPYMRYADTKGEGVRIGPEVPLSLADIIYADKKHLGDAVKWRDQHAPQARAISLEADQLISTFGLHPSLSGKTSQTIEIEKLLTQQ